MLRKFTDVYPPKPTDRVPIELNCSVCGKKFKTRDGVVYRFFGTSFVPPEKADRYAVFCENVCFLWIAHFEVCVIGHC